MNSAAVSSFLPQAFVILKKKGGGSNSTKNIKTFSFIIKISHYLLPLAGA